MKDIRLEGISFAYAGRAVLQDLSLTLPAGRITCLMGPSGCGKTTLFRLLCGTLSPDAGKISGIPHRISAVFQEDRLCEDFSALSNLRFAVGRAHDRARLVSLLDSLGLPGASPAPVRTFSGGMKRRVALARALAAEGELLLLDEPFKGLDEESRAAAVQVLLSNIGGKTVFLITHDPAEAALLGAPVLEMTADGRIFAEKA
ncbi:MAG: ATP-binding cassette domain-containing protein [Clostridia bacterium]|nr:ATP-binding cassette domain-containing protein [Clostridia bacterium]